MRGIAFTTALMASVALAQTDHRVAVGLNGLTFSPNSLTAAPQDTVTFEFHPKAHSVTQSSFAAPCTPLVNATTGQTGFDSGFVPVNATATSFPTYTLRITVSTPIWVYCKQGDHCQQGMVLAINPTADKTFAAFQQAAMSGAGANSTSASSAAVAGASSAGGSTGGSGGYGYGGAGTTAGADATSTATAGTSVGSGTTGSTSSSSGAGRTLASSGLAIAVGLAAFSLL